MWTLKRNDATNELRQQRLTDLEKEPVVAGVVVVEGAGIVGEFGMDVYCINTAVFKMDNQ